MLPASSHKLSIAGKCRKVQMNLCYHRADLRQQMITSFVVTGLTATVCVSLPGGRVTPVCGLYRYVPPQRVWVLSRFVINSVRLLYSSLEFGMLFRGIYFINFEKTINKSHSKIMFRSATVSAATVMKVSNVWVWS